MINCEDSIHVCASSEKKMNSQLSTERGLMHYFKGAVKPSKPTTLDLPERKPVRCMCVCVCVCIHICNLWSHSQFISRCSYRWFKIIYVHRCHYSLRYWSKKRFQRWNGEELSSYWATKQALRHRQVVGRWIYDFLKRYSTICWFVVGRLMSFFERLSRSWLVQIPQLNQRYDSNSRVIIFHGLIRLNLTSLEPVTI